MEHRPETVAPSARRILTILGIALFLRVLVPIASVIAVGDAGVFLYPDSGSYLRPTEELLRTGRFANDDRPEIDRTPGYPMLLLPGIALGKPVLVTITLQVILSVLTVFLVYRTSARVFQDEKAAAAAALLYSFEPLSILYTTLILTETLFTLLIVSFCFFLATYFRRQQALSTLILAAVSLSCSVYVRPVSYYLPFIVSLVLLPVLLVRYKKLKHLLHVVAFLVVSVGLVGLWPVRNKIETGYGGFSAISDINLYFYQAASVRAKVEGLPYLEVRRRMGYTDPDLYFAEHPEQLSWSDAQRYAFMGQEGAKTILRHPGVYAAVHMNGVVRILFDPGSVDYLKIFGLYPASGGILGKLADQGLVSVVLGLLKNNPLVFWTQLALFALLATCYLLAVLGLLGRSCPNVWARIAVAAVIVYFVIVSAGPHSYSRFRHPAMPFFCVLAGCGCTWLLRRSIDSRPAIRDSDHRTVTGGEKIL